MLVALPVFDHKSTESRFSTNATRGKWFMESFYYAVCPVHQQPGWICSISCIFMRQMTLLFTVWREVWRHISMVGKFLDHNNRELKQRWRRGQRERQKSYRFRLAKQQLYTLITFFFCTFLSRCCTTAKWNFLISRARFMELDTFLSDPTPENFSIWKMKWN